MKKIGIFGGSFDPIHYGHLGLAADAMKQVELTKVMFVPAKLQPFKLDKKMASGPDRLVMLNLALADHENFQASSFELDSEGISYTYLTLRYMQRKFGEGARLYFITGTDTFLKIEAWKEAEEMLTRYSFIIGTRPGFKKEELDACIKRVSDDYNTQVVTIHNTELDISSTEIRKSLKKGDKSTMPIPGKVGRYIKTHGLYRTDQQD
ncbi:MAG: nicotinate (nicotinamide) nucleotide adenylyltransferase [Clostridiales bacterium]|nr:nicotinate (nicotinamide) nucleotide adenylyltransferase [Clostridiales bacterium]